jgi:pimeloyl-ACP methyl ester carboxylesterase
VYALLTALQIDRVDLVGHSMGGYIAGRFAAAHPQQVRSLAFVDAAGVPFDTNDFIRALERGENRTRSPPATSSMPSSTRYSSIAPSCRDRSLTSTPTASSPAPTTGTSRWKR